MDVLSSFDILSNSATFEQPELCPTTLTRTFAGHVHVLSYVMLAHSKCHVPLLILGFHLTMVWPCGSSLSVCPTLQALFVNRLSFSQSLSHCRCAPSLLDVMRMVISSLRPYYSLCGRV